jgi:predicted nucleic acid-binding protein
VDSSVILSVVLNQPGNEGLTGLSQQTLVTSTLTKVEVLRVVTKTEDSLLPRAEKLLNQITFVAMDDVILNRASKYPSAITVKTLDAIHLATAEVISPLIEGIITFDKQMAKNAQLLNLKVYSITS